MSRGLPTSGTIKLSDVTRISYSAANVLRTDTFNTASANGSVTAPAGACAVWIEIWGGGGGGRGYSILNDYGGGGGGYTSLVVPCNDSVTMGYTVGAGGAGGAVGANGSFGSTSYAWSVPGFASSMFASPGGWGRTSAGLGGAGQTTYTGRLSDHSTVTGGDGTTSLGGTAGNGGAGGGSGAAGSVPGGGGGPGVTSGVAGGNGAPGQVKFTWYGRSSSANRLRHFLAGGSWIKAGAAGANRNIPASGTINLRDFLSFEEIGHYANASFEFSITNGTGGTQWANCKVQADGSFASPGVQYPAQTWMRRILGNDSSTITQHFDVLFNRTAASGYDTTLYGSAANTWLQCSSEPSWNVKAFLSGYGSVTSTATGYLAFRRRSDNVVVINVPATISATSFLEDPGPCPTCCFTPETPITMADYTTKPIGEVRIGDLILSRTGAKMVSEIIVREKREMHVIRFADGRELNASEDHPLYVKGKGYASVRPTVEYKDLGVPAILSEGDLVIDQNGNENEIVSITDLYYPHEVYTFAETEFYANGMLVY